MDPNNESGVCLPETLTSLFFLCLYSFSVAPMGAYSNGGPLGLGLVLVACWFAWRAFTLNKQFALLRRFGQLPLVIFVTYSAIRDAFAQFVLPWFSK